MYSAVLGDIMDRVSGLISSFQRLFDAPAMLAYRAPGRVNLIGEHTDYNDGFVLPAAIGYSCWALACPRSDEKLILHSENLGETVEVALNRKDLTRSHNWSDYPVGVACVLQKGSYKLRGANLYLCGEVPLGAGLSSSAALEVATACVLLENSGHKIDRTNIAKLCQEAENEFVGARVGIMDQFVCCNGRAGHALLLDCRSLEYRAVPLPLDLQLVVCNTMVKHEHGAGEYNVRRRECEEGVRRLSAALPGITALRDVTSHEFEGHRELLPETTYRRCKHVITENERVPKAAEALETGDLSAVGQLMAESHRSLRDDYQVSCAELDLMVQLAGKQPGVHGTRMTGGGFGGCTINLVERSATSEFKRVMARDYRAVAGREPEIFVCEAADGVERIDLAAFEPAIRDAFR